MKRLFIAVLLAALLIPSLTYARGWHGHGFGGAAIAAGILGGLATGIIINQALAPPPPPVVYSPPPVVYSPPPPSYYPPPPAPDPYASGYSEGYSQGVARGRYDRYDLGRQRGYDEGYNDARSGRVY